MIGVTLVMLVLLFVFFRYTRSASRCAPPPRIRSRPARRHPRRLDAGARLGHGGGDRRGRRHDVAPVVFLEPNMMCRILLYGFAGARARRADQPGRRGGRRLLVGVIENLAGAYHSVCRARAEADGRARASSSRC